MNISIKVIKHSEQAYKTVGDWKFIDGDLHIFVSDTGNDYYNALIGRHELDEALLCMKHSIPEEVVSKFDIEFEAERTNGLHDDEEPGDDQKAPYHLEHTIAEVAEYQLALHLGIEINDYEDVVSKL